MSEQFSLFAKNVLFVQTLASIIQDLFKSDKLNIATVVGSLLPQPLTKTYRNYYFDNPISRASPTMLACSKFILNQS